MKVTDVGLDNGYAIVRGWVGSAAAAPDVLVGGVTDGTTTTNAPTTLEFAGLTVDDLGNGVTLVSSSWKVPVRCATTVAGTLSTSFANGQTVDGITLATADRILIKNQASAIENGIYVVNASGLPSRSLDLGLSSLVDGAVVDVIAGTTNAATLWICTNTTAPVIDTDPITFALVNGAVTGVFETVIQGGGSTIKAHGSMGATETFNPADGNVHTGTLNANCTFALTAPASATTACTLEIRTLQDGTGSWTITWPGSVSFLGGTPTIVTTAGTTTVYIAETLDGGTSWVVAVAGGLGSSAFATPAIVLGTAAAAGSAGTVIRSDSTIVAFDATVPVTQALGDTAATGSAAVASRRDHKHGMPALSTATPLVESGSGAVGTALPSSREDHVHPASTSGSALAGSEHAHVVEETHLSDGATVTWTLDQNYMTGSVAAWNTTTLARLGVTEVLPDQATVSAAGTAGDHIMFDYAAIVGP